MECKLITVSFFWSSDRAFEELTQAVNEALSHGWEPVGGVAVLDQRGRLVQAMLKRR